MNVPTIKVRAWGEGQGDYVVINEADFDPKLHTLFEKGRASPLASDLEAGGAAKASPAKSKRKGAK